VVYPDAAQFAPTPPPGGTRSCRNNPIPDPNWDSQCSNQGCFGVPLYRLYQTGTENKKGTLPEFIRMAGSDICQSETMNVNHGLYYVDLTASAATQGAWPGLPGLPPTKNIFVGGQTYDFFLVYAKASTQQTYQMFVGAGLDPTTVTKGVKPIRVNIVNAPLIISPDTMKSGLIPPPTYNSLTGILTVTLNLGAFANDFTTAAKALCVPQLFCQSTASGCGGKAGGLGNLTQAERDTTCSYAGEDVDCPNFLNPKTGKNELGCVGYSVTLPGTFVANDQTTANNSALVKGLAMCFPNNTTWNVPPTPAPSDLAGTCLNAPINKMGDFCSPPTGAPIR
jgi:hypothetical protein